MEDEVAVTIMRSQCCADGLPCNGVPLDQRERADSNRWRVVLLRQLVALSLTAISGQARVEGGDGFEVQG